MKLYNLLFSLTLTLGILSCSKPIENVDTSVAAKTMLNVSYGTSTEQNMDIYLPSNRNSSTTKALIIIHGGGWNAGDKSDMTQFADSMIKRLPDYAVFNINYRLAKGSNLFPTQENDVKFAIQFIINNLTEYAVSDKLVLLGASAGGHLALLQGYKYASQINPKAIISFFGPTDLIDMYNKPLNAFIPPALVSVIGKTPIQDSLLYANSSPINFVSNTSSPTLLLHGGLDPLVRVSQSTTLRDKLASKLVISQYVFYSNEGHGWSGNNLVDSFNKIEAFLKANVK